MDAWVIGPGGASHDGYGDQAGRRTRLRRIAGQLDASVARERKSKLGDLMAVFDR